MIDRKRLDELLFQASHMGHSRRTVEKAAKEKKTIDPKMGTMIVVSPTELQHFLGAWELSDQVPALKEQIKKLQDFKDYVHERLDKMGVPHTVEGEHTDAGCRVGGRLDYVERFVVTPPQD